MIKKSINTLIISCFMLLVCFGLCACKKETTKITVNIYVDDTIYKTVELEESEIETYKLPALEIQKDNLYYFSGWTGDVENNKLKVEGNVKSLTVSGEYKPIYSVSSDGELSVDSNTITKSFEEMVVPSRVNDVTVTSIGSYEFRDFNNLTRIVLPNTLQSIDEGAFDYCWGLREVINLSDLNVVIGSAANGGVAFHAYFISDNINDRLECQNIDGTLYVESGEHLIAVGVADRNTKEITINKETDSISDFAFAFCKNVEKIYYNATACYGLPTTTHATCGVGADSKNVTVYVGANVKNIPDRLFLNSWSDDFYGNHYGATYIKNVIFAEGSQCENIGDYAFDNCIYLEKIDIPHNVKYIGPYAYNYCVNVQEINYKAIDCNNVSYLSFSLAYSGDQHEVVVNIAKGVQKIPANLFGSGVMASNSSISEINFEEDSVCERIGEHAFSHSNITKIVLPDSIQIIDTMAFAGCSLLTEIKLSNSLVSMGEGAFNDCDSLTTIVLPSSIETIGANALKLANLANIYFLGTATQWSAVEKTSTDYDDITISYYVEDEANVPNDDGSYWHYDTDGKTPILWEVAE